MRLGRQLMSSSEFYALSTLPSSLVVEKRNSQAIIAS